MKRRFKSIEEIEEFLAARGARIAGPDHPVYKEGPTIILLSRRRKPEKPLVARRPPKTEEDQ